MPQVPKQMVEMMQQPPGLLSETKPDSAQMLMAASLMHGMGRLGAQQGGDMPQAMRKGKTSKSKGMLK